MNMVTSEMTTALVVDSPTPLACMRTRIGKRIWSYAPCVPQSIRDTHHNICTEWLCVIVILLRLANMCNMEIINYVFV